MQTRDERIDSVQSQQYDFPYHYIPNVKGYPKFCRRSAYAPSYLAAIQIAVNWLSEDAVDDMAEKHEHIDIGCGDGGFVKALTECESLPSVEFSGIDMDSRAISWAKMFNPGINFTSESIEKARTNSWDSGSLIEVIEHIPPSELSGFTANVARIIRPGGKLLVTVPSNQVPVSPKHYQHFTFESLKKVFATGFEVRECFGFERRNCITRFYFRHFFKRRFHLEVGSFSRYIIKTYATKYQEISGCRRIGLILTVC